MAEDDAAAEPEAEPEPEPEAEPEAEGDEAKDEGESSPKAETTPVSQLSTSQFGTPCRWIIPRP